MDARGRLAAFLLVCGVAAGCGYSLPMPLQQEVDTMVQQVEGVYGVVRTVKKGGVDAAAADNVRKRYDELVGAHDDWLANVQRVIATQIDHYEVEDTYSNSVTKLANAADAFEKAADAALGSESPANVPDWSVESRELMTRAYNERKNKNAAEAIYAQLKMKRWDEIS
jgi:hypothetical protein